MALDAERTERPSIEVEGQKRAICTGRDCDEARHLINYPSRCAGVIQVAPSIQPPMATSQDAAVRRNLTLMVLPLRPESRGQFLRHQSLGPFRPLLEKLSAKRRPGDHLLSFEPFRNDLGVRLA